MTSLPEFEAALAHARQLHVQGRVAEAETAYKNLLGIAEYREAALQALSELYWHAKRPREAIDALIALTHQVPDRLYYYAQLAALLDGLGHTEAAIGHYLRLLKNQPLLAAAHFNLALLYKKEKRFDEALKSYEESVRLGIDHVEEVYSNMGVLYSEMRDVQKADEMYRRASALNPEYTPALFNRAGLCEEAGQRQQAIDSYRRILKRNPRHWDSLARLAHIQKITAADHELLQALKHGVETAKSEPLARESLYFALGKALDDLGQYADAFAAYRAANELGKLRNPAYDSAAVERTFDRLIEIFDERWLSRFAATSNASPIFICGMFRSGSTLLEQILAAHPAITAGGELDVLPWLIARKLSPYPQRINSATASELRQIAQGYLQKVQELLGTQTHFTDKRPDNFLHLGLIKVLFPGARIIYTQRDALDNRLSIYFQQLGGNLNYATDLEHIAHYQGLHERLMVHWQRCFPANIFIVGYDELVRDPEPVLRRLLEFLGFEWDARCLQFENVDSAVKTASVWQVRQALHTASSGRWRNYRQWMKEVAE